MKPIPRFTFQPVLWIVLHILIALIAYRGVVTAGFIGSNDNVYVSANRVVQQGLTPQGIRWAFTTFHASTWQPLAWLSYMLDVSIHGPEPAGFHLTNLILHLTNIGLAFIFIRKITGFTHVACIAALLLAIHPVHVESVVWIAERKGLLSTTFGLLSLLAYTSFTTTRRKPYYLAAALALALGLMTNAVLITLPILFLLLDHTPWQPLRPAATATQRHHTLWERMPFWVLALGAALLTGYAQHNTNSLLGLDAISLWERSANALISIWRYLWHFVCPVRLALFYPHPIRWPLWLVLPTVPLSLATIYCLFKYRHRYPDMLWGGGWFLITLLPFLGFIQFGWHAMADRFLYLPAIGIYIAIGSRVHALYRRAPLATRTGSVMATILLVSLTQWQTGHWQNNIAIFSRAVAVTRNNWVMHNSLGTALTHAGRHSEAIPHFERSIEHNPRNATAYFNLGHVRFVQEDWDAAANLFAQSLALESNYQALFNLAVTHTRRGAPEQAKQAYLHLLETYPTHTQALINLGKLYREDKEFDQALACFRIVHKEHPTHQAARTGMAVTILATADDPLPAIAMLMQLLQEDPNNQEARQALHQAIHGP